MVSRAGRHHLSPTSLAWPSLPAALGWRCLWLPPQVGDTCIVCGAGVPLTAGWLLPFLALSQSLPCVAFPASLSG